MKHKNASIEFSRKKPEADDWDLDGGGQTCKYLDVWVWISRSITMNGSFGSYGQSRVWFYDQKQQNLLLFLSNEFEVFLWDVDWRAQASSYRETKVRKPSKINRSIHIAFFVILNCQNCHPGVKTAFKPIFPIRDWNFWLSFWWRKPKLWLQRRSVIFPDWQDIFCNFWASWNVAKLIKNEKENYPN